MKSRIERWEKYRRHILTAPEWSFNRNKLFSSKHSVDEKAMAGKSIGYKAVALENDKKGPRMLGYDTYQQGKQMLSILKATLFVVAIVLMIILYVLWVR